MFVTVKQNCGVPISEAELCGFVSSVDETKLLLLPPFISPLDEVE